ncbi:phage holin [Salipaludibacillus agaradhaerens]|jgi:phi LC3 family holin|uniref:Phage holin n=1 Tax=Salipaludibacillus agaradhaerens TaxID=76935 RepID=A0A9Q4FYZ6_SALAG|nr:phage holin [Salipaludibacillus agaradhaerens]MCR6096841.1 phage holin [Salipaludibacillus agaradhaerens]MCR6116685.1 phage holin [Salipaludibacillus agaradhaerens]
MINWKVRFKNPQFLAQLVLAVLTPIIAYMGLTFEDLTTWIVFGDVLLQAISNPYVLGLVAVSVYNAVSDPTTEGLSDSVQALTYDTPKKKGDA